MHVRSAQFIPWEPQLSGKVLGPGEGEARAGTAHRQAAVAGQNTGYISTLWEKTNLVGITQRDTKEKESNLARQFVFEKKKKKIKKM